jgi:RTX calcium-binding nonapeptide repeat (4 copies)
MTKGKMSAVLAAAGALAILAMAPAAASAAECSIDDDSSGAPALLDSGGYEWDISQETKAAPANDDTEDFATLYDGGGETNTTPPAPENNSDTFDGFGALFVGPGGDGSLANQYFSPDDNSCSVEDSGRTLAFPALPVNGLTVQRKLYVAAGGLPGGVLIQTLSNRSGAPITTDVQIGDTHSNDNYGDLGSDSETAVRFSSSGDAAISPADLWFVTNDSTTDTSDFSLAHVMDGNGGRERVDFVTQTGLPAETPEDNVAWRWSGITVNPGQTITLISVEIQQGVAGSNSANQEAANAAAQANAYEAATPATLFPTLGDKTEQAQIANWSNPVKCGGRAVTISGSDVRDVIKGTKKPDVIWAGGGNDKVLGKKGNDRICGGPGKDKLIGGPGKRDVLKGGGGKDKVRQ